MDIDVDIARWVLEFIVQQESVDDRTLNALISVLPLPENDLSFKKSLILRRISSEIARGKVSEKVLEFLEQIEELDYREGIEASEAMKSAYCAVAVHCTVKFLGGGDSDSDREGEYFDAVKRIWRGRIRAMMRFEMPVVGLVSEELRRWEDEIEAGVWDVSGCKNVLVKSKGIDAVGAVRVYIDDAKKNMGPSFLELVAETLSDEELSEVLGLGKHGECGQVGEGSTIVPDALQDEVSGLGKDRKCDQVSAIAPIVHDPQQDLVAYSNIQGKRGEFPQVRENASIVPNAQQDVVGVSSNRVLTEEKDGQYDQVRVHAPVVPDAEQDVVADSSSQVLTLEKDGECGQVRERLLIVPDGQQYVVANSSNRVLTLEKDGECDQARETAPVVPDVQHDVVADSSNRETTKGKRRKHVARRHFRGAASGTSRAKIVDSEELVEASGNRYVCLPTPEVNKVQEALETSSLELQAVVKDPLPDAIRVAESVISNMARSDMVHDQVVGDHNSVDVDAPSSSVDKRADDQQANAGDNSGPKSNLMARNNTAQTIEWEDSIDSSAEESPRRPHLSSPKRRVVAPVQPYEIRKPYKKRKRWSTLEEDTLRTGVQKYGKGRWKLILTMYPDIFEDRTDVDLKDKWRNMTRY